MRLPPLRSLLSVLAAALALAACFGDPAGPTEFPSGSVRFLYVPVDSAGTALTADSVAFAAEGGVTTDNYFSGTYAFGLRSTTFEGDKAVRVYGQQAQATEGTYDGLLLFIANPAVGTYTCTAATSPVNCRFAAAFTVGASEDEITSRPTIRVSARAGTVVITSVDGDRVRGTFSLLMRGQVGEQTDALLRLSGGAFDVPITSADSPSVPD
ncbi:MAG TPA: hypothetical protein VF665_05000 [Longimicrobium sp.]|jgi:hypothetical protein|uniref:hypothetical protein n=1 Tax=Longimicrobium sp. TaxID=2029185 RepID=UPI002EDA7769